MPSIYRILLSGFLILAILHTYGQERLYNFRYFTNKDGMPTNKIRTLAEDNQGILWMATDKGLVSYDGFRFHTIQLSDANSNFTNDLSSLSIDLKSSKIWLTSYNEGLICYDRSKPLSTGVRFYSARVGKQQLVKNELYEVYVAKSGNVYFGGQETDLQFYNPQKDTIEYVQLDAKKGIQTILGIQEDKEGNIWVATRYGGIYILNPKTRAIQNIDLHNSGENGGRNFAFLDTAIYLSYYDHNLIKLKPGSNAIDQTNLLKIGKNIDFYDNEITDIKYIAKYDNLLLSHAREGLLLYNLKTNTTNKIGWESILPNQNIQTKINDLLQTRSGIYIATDKGLLFYSESLNVINDFIPFPEEIEEVFHVGNQPWIRSKYFLGKLDLDYSRIRERIPFNNLKVSAVNIIEGEIYLSTFNSGVYRVDQKRKSIIALPIEGEEFNFRKADCNSIISDVIDNEAILWIGSWNSGLYKYNTTKRTIQLFNTTYGLVDNKVINISKDSKGNIWLGLDGFGVARLEDKKTGKFSNYLHDPNQPHSLNSNSVLSFLLDQKGNFWYGSSANGIGRIDINRDVTFDHIKDPNRIKKIYARSLKEDKFGRIWMKTSDAAMLFDPKYNQFLPLEEGDGIFPPSSLLTNSFSLIQDKIIWATNRGLVLGDINKVQRQHLDVSRVVVSQFRVFNEDCSYKLHSSNIILEPNQNSFSFYLSCPELVKHKNVRYAYQLDNIDKEWIISDDANLAIYTNLEAGSYTFHVRVVDMEGNWSNHVTTYQILVKGKWYKSNAFKVFIALFILSLIIGFLFYRIDQQKALNKLHTDFNLKLKDELIANEKKIIEQQKSLEIERKEKIEVDFRKQLYESELKAIRSQMNPHFIFNVLNSIEAYVVENNKIKASKLIHKFASLSRIVLENSQSSMVNIDSELQLVQLYLDLERERFDNMFEYKIEVDDEIDIFNDKIPSMLIQPIVENAVHHGIRHLNNSNGYIKIVLQKNERNMIISVFDNGIGIQNQEKSSIKKSSFGIKGVESRLKMLNPNSKDNIRGIFINTLPAASEFTTLVKMIFPILK